jgi:hypothetical protein
MIPVMQPLSTQNGQSSQPSKIAQAFSSGLSVNILSILAFVAFLVCLITIGGGFLLQGNLVSQKAYLENQLIKAEQQFEKETIEKAKVLDSRLILASSLLVKHKAIAHFFESINQKTLDTILFTSFTTEALNPKDNTITFRLAGEANSYKAIAEQSQLFGDDTLLSNHVFSNFSVLNTGKVDFALKFYVKPEKLLLSYSLDKNLGSLEVLDNNNLNSQ